MEAQQRDRHSLMNTVEHMIRVRKEHPELGMGEWSILDVGEPSIFALRACWKSGVMVAVHNFSGKPCKFKLKLPDSEASRLVDALGSDEYRVPKGGVCELELDGYGYRWLRVAMAVGR